MAIGGKSSIRIRSIKGRLAFSFLFIIVVTVLILELLLINIVRHNYYKSLEGSLYNQVQISAEFYQRYFSDTSLYENVLNNVDTFWRGTSAQVEIIDTAGKVILDSSGVLPEDTSRFTDMREALEGKRGSWTGKVSYSPDMVMAVSYPLRSDDKIVGVLRFIASLREVNEEIKATALIFVLIGLVVVVFTGLMSFILAGTIVNPIKEVTHVAQALAGGDFRVKSVYRNDDEIGKLSDTMNYMAEEILKREQLKNDFISSVSHELRTPLTSIKGWAITLKDSKPEEREVMADGLDIIEKEADRLTAMVEELLDFSRFVSEKVTIRHDPVNVEQVVKHIQKQLSPRAERESIHFDVLCPDEMPLLYTDENRLKQVFINILDNAFRFTPAGGSVTFSVEYRKDAFMFSVVDTGCGIAPDELPRVKEKFFKGKTGKSHNGIGLSICDEIVRLMKGTLDIRSRLHEGTEVRIVLPIQA